MIFVNKVIFLSFNRCFSGVFPGFSADSNHFQPHFSFVALPGSFRKGFSFGLSGSPSLPFVATPVPIFCFSIGPDNQKKDLPGKYNHLRTS